jgi:hypothetical protein
VIVIHKVVFLVKGNPAILELRPGLVVPIILGGEINLVSPIIPAILGRRPFLVPRRPSQVNHVLLDV